MIRLLIAVGVSASLFATPVLAETNAECSATWTKIDSNNTGTVLESEAARYYAALRIADAPLADGKLTRAAFLEHCKAGVFSEITTDAGAPLSGANSYTEAQATDRAIAAGFANVSALVKDENGVWRGTTSDGSKTLQIAVDFKGNVTTN